MKTLAKVRIVVHRETAWEKTEKNVKKKIIIIIIIKIIGLSANRII